MTALSIINTSQRLGRLAENGGSLSQGFRKGDLGSADPQRPAEGSDVFIDGIAALRVVATPHINHTRAKQFGRERIDISKHLSWIYWRAVCCFNAGGL